ncbi:protein O-GlcNAcase [Adelges cooleyi]|uniref:protein O-GlcNAcase n=1 Tax=Adelges cooleyi TaxID=133065 RepID=UPI00217F63BD|nr:protein O-GlcNAcase [Adelges cooleyi]XP_050437433.1 protein O-GlcNAcase [Adelges cooleyi]XP_050437434.1 protein O-GlcNAcase [Adelges cooleyi]XP_050437435.1 protein O-GlcNAcase [Adelges cooleyi]XP_050437436.1 protein O-GlcNAcase [Adelges cooleyi]
MADNSYVSPNDNFICGVVEGFYGRPWTTEQRKDLFQKLKKWGVGCYVYAPKDDYKHRAYWRDLYTVEEAEQLGGLIAAARDCGVTLYYALSPGLDMTYSSQKEVSTLKRKLDQVAQCGCKAFALLFDDIEPDMSPADKEVFQSFAHAQVSITNEIFQHLGQPKFLVCPTQYCSARAVPNVQNSDYLNTLGSKLAPQIDIMWTGQKVISRLLTTESIREITEVLRRPPVIWDNLHANDYDQKRVFLGPYLGRSPDLISQLRGVLTNPNCEYGANFIAINTLAQWSKCNSDPSNTQDNESMKLETESDEEGVVDLPDNIYHARRALRVAIKEWKEEFRKPKQAHGPISKPQPTLSIMSPIAIPLPSFNTCMATSTTTITTSTSTTPLPMCTTNNVETISTPSVNGNSTTLLQPAVAVSINPPTVIMNSLVSENKVISEPMDCNMSSPAPSPQSSDTAMNTDNGSSVSMQVETPSPSVDMIIDVVQDQKHSYEKDLTEGDLLLLCDLFYLPFEHGFQSVQYLQEFNWLKSNAYLVSKENIRKSKKDNATESKPEVDEWFNRSRKMDELSEQVNELFQRLAYSANRELVHDLYPYVWDIRCVVSLLNSYIKWLSLGHFPQSIINYTLGSYTWFSKGWKESFMSGDQEPWVFRGGLVADLQRLMPVDAGSDLFIYKPPDIPTNKMYNVRPYTFDDESAVYNICRCTCYTVNEDNSIKKSDHPDLIPDRIVGAFLTFSPEFCFVIEDNGTVIGYALAALDAKEFYQKLQVSWLPEMCSKYPMSTRSSNNDIISAFDEIINWFHMFDANDELPESSALSQHKSVMTYSILPVNNDSSVSKRLIICLLAALRANGSFGVHLPVRSKERQTIEVYTKMGFMELAQGTSRDNGITYLGRVF